MIVETTLGRVLFLRMGTWLIPADRETNRKRKELRRWITERAMDPIEEAEIQLLPGGGFSYGRGVEDADLPVEIDFSTDQLNLLQAMFQRGVIWPNSLTDEQDEEVDALELDVTEWIEQDQADRAARTLSKKQKKRLAEELQKETDE